MRSVEPVTVRALLGAYAASHPDEVARALQGSTREEILRVLRGLPEREAATVFARLGAEKASAVLPSMDSDLTRAVAGGQNVQRFGSIVRRLDQDARGRILQTLPPGVSARVRAVFEHPPGTAGAYLHGSEHGFSGGALVEVVLNELRERGPEAAAQNIYVTGASDTLEGVVPVSRLVAASSSTPIGDLSTPARVTINPAMPRGRLLNLLEEHRLLDVPVVDSAGRFLGIVRQVDLLERDELEARRSMYTSGEPAIDEQPDTPAFQATRIRLPWLLAQGVGASLIVFVAAGFGELLSESILLAVLLPLVIVLAQRAGFQAVNVCLDGLSLGVIAPGDWRSQLVKELKLGILSGAVASALFGSAVYYWTGSRTIAISLGAACAAAIPAAMAAGGVAPLAFLALGQRPAKIAFIAVTTLGGTIAALIFLLAASALR